jgi:signal transduction histidine kinase
VAEDARRDANETPPVRELRVLGPDGQVVGQGQMRQIRGREGSIPTFELVLPDGNHYTVQIPRRDHRPPPGPPWARGPYATYGYIWLLAIVALAVALGVYPLIRRLTRRLEALQRSVADWGSGKLSVRATVRGRDEVADLARRFNSAADHIEALIDAQKSLLANASHELRSPLARIRLAVELMAHNPSPATRGEIKRNIAELDQLVDEILLASRLDARQADLGTEESVDMLGLAAEEAALTGAELQLDGDPAACQVRGVAKLLRRMVRNLLENAKRYGDVDPDQPVQVSLKPDGQALVIAVADHGPGVPEAMRERIFEPFFRTPGASETAGGVGLGLALVRSIAQRHGGSVHCEGRADGQPGACFVLRLPAA